MGHNGENGHHPHLPVGLRHEVVGHSDPIIRNPQLYEIILGLLQDDFDPAVAITREGVFHGIRNDLTDDQPAGYCGIDQEGDVFDIEPQVDLSGRNTVTLDEEGDQVADIVRHVDVREVARFVELLVHERHRADLVDDILEYDLRRLLLQLRRMQPEERRNDLHVVFRTVVELADQGFIFREGLAHLRLDSMERLEGCINTPEQHNVGNDEGDVHEQDIQALDDPGEELEIPQDVPDDQAHGMKDRESHTGSEIDPRSQQRRFDADEETQDEDADREKDTALTLRTGQDEGQEADQVKAYCYHNRLRFD